MMKKTHLILLIFCLHLPLFAQEGGMDDRLREARRLYEQGNLAYEQSDYPLARNSYERAYKLMEDSDSSLFLSDVLTSLGIVYDYLGVYERSMSCYQQSLQLAIRLGDQQRMSCAINNIGALYFFWKKYDAALDYYEWSLRIETETGNLQGMAGSYENIGIVYKNLGEMEKALKSYLQSLEINQQLKDTIGISTTYDNLGSLLLESGEPEQAQQYFRLALGLQHAINDRLGITFSLIGISQALKAQGKKQESLNMAFEAATEAESIGLYTQLQIIYEIIAGLSEETGAYAQACSYYRKYSAVKDSVFSVNAHRQMIEMKTRYETDRKDRELEIQKLKIDKQQAQIGRDRYILLSVIGLMLFIAGFTILLSFWYIQKKNALRILMRQNLEIVRREQELKSLKTEDTAMPELESSLDPEPEQDSEKLLPAGEKYSGSQLTEEHKQHLIQRLSYYTEQEKVYLDSQLNIEALASMMKTNRRYLSQVINEVYRVNFNQFINDFRVKEARRMLLDQEYRHLSIEGIATSVGFNSRVSFINAFKKVTGLTPSYFQKTTETGKSQV
jgi:AraC-like DNA-binding protein/Tfp pilus assembly protein PilF